MTKEENKPLPAHTAWQQLTTQLMGLGMTEAQILASLLKGKREIIQSMVNNWPEANDCLPDRIRKYLPRGWRIVHGEQETPFNLEDLELVPLLRGGESPLGRVTDPSDEELNKRVQGMDSLTILDGIRIINDPDKNRKDERVLAHTNIVLTGTVVCDLEGIHRWASLYRVLNLNFGIITWKVGFPPISPRYGLDSNSHNPAFPKLKRS